MTQAQDPFLRSASLELLEVLLRQGLVNPNDAVPYLFALQGDIANNSIRSHALRLLMTEAEKRPDMIRQRVCAGIKKAYEFQRTLNPDQTSVSALVEKHHGKITSFECIFDSVFIECIRSSAKQRHGLYRNLLSLFEVVKESGSGRGHSKSLDRVDLDLLSFSSQVLAHLPYNSVGDPLFIIYHISSTIAFQGSQLLDRLADVLRPVGLASDDELDETNVGEDALERAAKTKFPKNTQEAKALGSKDFDSKTFMTLCRDGAALTLLLRLKSHLRALYNLTETRCLEYDPLAKERICDKGVSKTDVRKPFVAQLHMNSKPKKSDIDSLIRQYADFRRLMREESASTGSASEAQLEAAESDEASDIENVKVPDEEME
jgi:cohesin loading factor subunit SCC2